MSALFNGRPVENGWDAARGLHYGDGVFRTALVWDGRVSDEDRQLAVLARDAAALDIDLPDRELLLQEMRGLAAAAGQGALKILLSRSATGRGYAPATRQCERLLRLTPLPACASSSWTAGISMAWSRVLLGIQPRLAGIKHLNRLEQVLASRDWAPDQQEALMCDAEGRVVCGTRSNVFCVIDGILVTPELSRAGVAGCTRGRLIALAQEQGIACETGLLAPDELRHATECFVCNSLIGLWPVRRLGSLEFPAPGPVTRRLAEALNHPWSGA